MEFKEHLFPDTLAEGAEGGRDWNTHVIRTGGGQVETDQKWPVPLGTWRIEQRNRTLEEAQVLQNFFHTVRGRAFGFRFLDPLDSFMNNVPAARLTSTTFQMRQAYRFGGETLYLNVKKPAPGDPHLLIRFGTVAATPDTYTVNTATGIITFFAALNANIVVNVSGTYHIPVMFGSDHFGVRRVEQGLVSWPDIVLWEVPI